ncbi:MAG TPA: hypothetical protein VN749_08325 [Candidatus Eisenbacteria bacterium]|nr:hypothetical protein [Candidatus Eisenbacteria bacterium]
MREWPFSIRVLGASLFLIGAYILALVLPTGSAISPVKQFRLVEKIERSKRFLSYVCGGEQDESGKEECVESFEREGAVWAGDVNDDGVDEYIMDSGAMPATMGPPRSLIQRRGEDWVDLTCLGEENECDSGWNTLRGRFDILPIVRDGYHDLRIAVDRCLKWNGQHYLDYALTDYEQLHEEWFDTTDSHEAELFWIMRYQLGKNTRFEPRWFTVSADEFAQPVKAYIGLPVRVVEIPKLPYVSREDPKLSLKWLSFFKGGVWCVKGDRAFLLVPQPSYLGAQRLELRGDWLLIYGEVEDSTGRPEIRYNRRTHELRYTEN